MQGLISLCDILSPFPFRACLRWSRICRASTLMKKIVLRIASLVSSLALLAGVGLFANFDAPAKEADAVGSYSTNASTYYSEITATGGKQLAAQLHDLITSTHQYYASYADNGGNGYQKHTDQYYENGSPVEGYIYEFYSGVKWPNGWYPDAGDTRGGYNREHCWCQYNSKNAAGTQMWGQTGGGADMHHLRPVETRLNSTRSNNKYGEISGRDSYKVYAKNGTNETYALGGYNKSSTFEPLDSKKGDVARIILYTYLHYNSYTISDIFGSYGTTNGSGSNSYFSTSLLSLTKTTNKSTEADALEMLLSWNASDPVDEIEQRRNEQVAFYQGNRNPFIDNSNYAELIWGTGTIAPTVTSVSVNPTSLELDVNGTNQGQLTATVNVTGGLSQAVTWSSSNDSVATVSETGLVTAVAKGSCSITATSVANPNKSASCSVKVANSSGGSTISSGTYTWDLSKQTYETPTSEELVVWNSEFATMEAIHAPGKTAANNYLGGDSNNRTSSRFYSGNSLVITPASAVEITSVVFVATSINYATAFGNSTWINATASVDGTTVTITPTNGKVAISATIGGTCGFTSATLNYTSGSSSSASPLESISLNTSNTQTEFTVGDSFDYSGLVVTAHYEDGTEDFVDPTSVSSPNMTTAGTKEITVSYTENSVTKTAKYNITVVEPQATEIIASVTMTYHPGETIAKSDIHVEDDLGNVITDFEFSEDGYQFLYLDAPEGGLIGSKIFAESISYGEFIADLQVSVCRNEHAEAQEVVDTMTASWTGAGTSYTTWSGKVGNSGAVYAGNSMAPTSGNACGSIQMRSDNSNSGIVSTLYPGSAHVAEISVVWHSYTTAKRTLNIYGKNSPYSSASDLYSASTQGTLLGTIVKGTSTSLTITDDYKYIGIRSNSGALYLNEIEVVYSLPDSAENVANYIMFEDAENQCVSKYDEAKELFLALPAEMRSTFMTSSDYVIASARERLQAWAAHEGETIIFVNGDYAMSSSGLFVSSMKKRTRRFHLAHYPCRFAWRWLRRSLSDS